jgi:hypothetical protein
MGTTPVNAQRTLLLGSSSSLQSLEDLSTMYDGTVRNSSGGIVQLTYGDDGMDPVCMEAKDGQPVDFPRILMKTKVSITRTDSAREEVLEMFFIEAWTECLRTSVRVCQGFARLVQTRRVLPGWRNPSGSKLVSRTKALVMVEHGQEPGSLGYWCPKSGRSNGFRCISHQIPLAPGSHHCCMLALTLTLGF